MASSTPVTKPRPIFGPPQTDEECRALKEWAETLPPHREEPATDAEIIRHLKFMGASLPAQAVDTEAGKQKLVVYVTLLRGFSDAALGHMAMTACSTLRWFPVPAQCLDLVRDYRGPVSEKESTLKLCHDFAQNSFDRWMTNVSEGQPIGDVPEQWLRIAVERGPLRRMADGSFVSRALYHGPVKPVLSLVSA